MEVRRLTGRPMTLEEQEASKKALIDDLKACKSFDEEDSESILMDCNSKRRKPKAKRLK